MNPLLRRMMDTMHDARPVPFDYDVLAEALLTAGDVMDAREYWRAREELSAARTELAQLQQTVREVHVMLIRKGNICASAFGEEEVGVKTLRACAAVVGEILEPAEPDPEMGAFLALMKARGRL